MELRIEHSLESLSCVSCNLHKLVKLFESNASKYLKKPRSFINNFQIFKAADSSS